MIITKEEYQEYIGDNMPPMKYYDIAVNQLKKYCNCFKVENLNDNHLNLVKKAIMLQMDYYYKNENQINGINESFTIGKFSKGGSNANQSKMPIYNQDAINIVEEVFNCKRWVHFELY